jgi:hypothetical protein
MELNLPRARTLVHELSAKAATPIHASYLPGEQLPGAGPFITALNNALESLAHRARSQCNYVDDAVTKTSYYLQQAQSADAGLARRFDQL